MEEHSLHWLALTTEEIVASKFPGRVVLTPEELAEVWKGKTTRGVVEGIRAKLKAGTLIPGLKKNGGRWEIPVEDLIKVIKGLADDSKPRPITTPTMSNPTPGRRNRPPLGQRRDVYDYQTVWQAVFDQLDLFDAEETKKALREAVTKSGVPDDDRII